MTSTGGSSRSTLGGPEFNLSLELGAAGNELHVGAVLSALWTCPEIDGPWEHTSAIGMAELRGGANQWPDNHQWRFGNLNVGHDFRPLPFTAYIIREQRASVEQTQAKIQFGVQTQEPSDWLTLGIPVSALSRQWHVDNSWIPEKQPWLKQLCKGLADVADHIHQLAGIVCGAMGEEVSGCWRSASMVRAREAHQEYPPLAVMDEKAVEGRGAFVLSAELGMHLASKISPQRLTSGLLYVPPIFHAALTGA